MQKSNTKLVLVNSTRHSQEAYDKTRQTEPDLVAFYNVWTGNRYWL